MIFTLHDHEFIIDDIQTLDGNIIDFKSYLELDGRKMRVLLRSFLDAKEHDRLYEEIDDYLMKIKEEDDIYQAGERYKSKLVDQGITELLR